MSDALKTLQEGVRLAELNGEQYFLPRLPNTIGWIYRELQDIESAMRLDRENVPLARELDFPEGEANAHVNLGHDYLLVGEPDRALEHLREAEKLFD